jgi:hypothetical protein
LQEAHGGGLMGHFGVKKTEDVLAAHFFWPRLRRDVERYVSRCTTCNKDLKPYLGEEDELELRTTPIQEGEDDENISPLHTMQGPITRARAQQLDLQVRSNHTCVID